MSSWFSYPQMSDCQFVVGPNIERTYRQLMPDPIYKRRDRQTIELLCQVLGYGAPTNCLPYNDVVILSERGGFGGMAVRHCYGLREPSPNPVSRLRKAKPVSSKAKLLIQAGHSARHRY